MTLHDAGRVSILSGILSCLMAAACSSPAGPDRIPVVQLLQDSAVMTVGDTLQAVLLPMLPPGYVPPVSWSSSDPAVAEVSATGTTSARVDALQAGLAVIRVAGEGARDSLVVWVTSAQPPLGSTAYSRSIIPLASTSEQPDVQAARHLIPYASHPAHLLRRVTDPPS
jgi:hypothetical protein